MLQPTEIKTDNYHCACIFIRTVVKLGFLILTALRNSFFQFKSDRLQKRGERKGERKHNQTSPIAATANTEGLCSSIVQISRAPRQYNLNV